EQAEHEDLAGRGQRGDHVHRRRGPVGDVKGDPEQASEGAPGKTDKQEAKQKGLWRMSVDQGPQDLKGGDDRDCQEARAEQPAVVAAAAARTRVHRSNAERMNTSGTSSRRNRRGAVGPATSYLPPGRAG